MVELSTASVALRTVFCTALDYQVTYVTVHIIFCISIATVTVVFQIMLSEYSLLLNYRICWACYSADICKIYRQTAAN